MAVVALHPVVVHLKGIGLRFLSVDKDLSVADLQVVGLINLDGTLIDSDIIQRQLDRLALFRNPDRTVVVARPVLITIQRVDLQIVGLRIQGDALHDVLSGLEGGHGLLGQRHIA